MIGFIKGMMLGYFLLWGGFLYVGVPTQSYAMSLDDDEEDREDAEDYLRNAKQKANNENFSGAKEELKKAKILGVLKSDVKDTESYVKGSERNYEARLQAERDRQARMEAEKIEKEKQAKLSRRAKELNNLFSRDSGSSYSSSSSSSSSQKTSVSYVCTTTCTGKWGSKRGGKISRIYTASVSDPNSYIAPAEIIVKSERAFEEYCENTWSFHDNRPGNGASKGYVSCMRK